MAPEPQPARAPISVLLAGLSLAAAAPAAAARAAGAEDELRGEVHHVWPEVLNKGYFPVWIEIENLSESEAVVGVAVHSGSEVDRLATRKTVRLAGAETATVELFVPAFAQGASFYGWSGMSVRLNPEGSRPIDIPGQVVLRTGERSLRAALVLSDRESDRDEERDWAKDLGQATIQPFGPWSGRDPEPDVAISSARIDAHMPARVEGYSSLDLVALDLDARPPDAERLAVLCSWLRRGGRLLLFGASADERARSLPGVGDWMEPRFRLPLDERRSEAFMAALGVLYLCDAPGPFLADDEHRRVARAALRPEGSQHERTRWVPREHWAAGFPGMIPVPGVGELPYGVFLLLLLAFALLIGPANFSLIRRLGRPALLLVSVPAISLGASLLLLSYGVFHSGLDTRETVTSLTVLDQRAQRATCLQACTLYSGLSPAEGLRPGAGTEVHPVNDATEGRRYTVDLTAGALLSEAYLPVREPFRQVRLSERAAHVGLELSREPDGTLRARNGFPCELRSLVVADADGSRRRAPQALAPGAEAMLEPVEAEAAQAEGNLLRVLSPGRGSFDLPAGCYLAFLGAPLFGDDCGIESEELVGEHQVLGVLPADPAR